MVISRKVATRIQPYFGHRSCSRLVLTARALRSRESAFDSGSKWRAMRTMLSEFASHEVEGVKVRLTVDGPDGPLLDTTRATDKEGYVRFDVALEPAWDQPEHPAWEVVALHWENRDGPQSVEAHVLVPGTATDLAVISDIDDTIIETGITGGLGNIARNWQRIFAQLPHDRIAVPGAGNFYSALGGEPLGPGEKGSAKRMTATRRPFFYVSSSPWNLFSYLVAFQRTKGLPLGPLKLRDWGLNRETFGSSSHGAHKTAAIEGILDMYPALSFALIGDDTQGDLPAFADAIETHPGRIVGVFLRKAAADPFSPEEVRAKAVIEEAGVPLWLGDDYATGVDFVRTLGTTPGGETEQIVKVVEDIAEADEEGTPHPGPEDEPGDPAAA